MKNTIKKYIKEYQMTGKFLNNDEVYETICNYFEEIIINLKDNFNINNNYCFFFHFINNYFKSNNNITVLLTKINKETNYKENMIIWKNSIISKIENNEIDDKTFNNICKYIYVNNYSNIDNRICDYLLKEYLLENRNIPTLILQQLIRSFTSNKLKEIGIFNNEVEIKKTDDNCLAMCSSNLNSRNIIMSPSELRITITFNPETFKKVENIDLLEVVFHELRHAEIRAKSLKQKTYYYYDILKCYCIGNLIDDNADNYKYDKEEIDANIFAIINTYKYIKKIFPNFAIKYLKENKEFKELNKYKKNNNFSLLGIKDNLDMIFDDFIKVKDNYLQYSYTYPIINREYKLKNGSVVRKSTLELIDDLTKVKTAQEYGLINNIINKRYMELNDLLQDTIELLNNINNDNRQLIKNYIKNNLRLKIKECVKNNKVQIFESDYTILMKIVKETIDSLVEEKENVKVRCKNDKEYRRNNS